MTPAEQATGYDERSRLEMMLHALRGLKTDVLKGGVGGAIEQRLPVPPQYMDTPTVQPNPNGFKRAPLPNPNEPEFGQDPAMRRWRKMT
jgi:hypothetical protein